MKKIIGFYRPCDLLTMTGTFLAVLGMILAINHFGMYAMFCLIGSGICDAFDGYLARKHEYNDQQKLYGVELDSLSDVISFGVFPVVFAISMVGNNIFLYIVGAFYVLCGMIRLAYYNVLSADKNNSSQYFLGIPITTIAIILPVLYIIFYYTSMQYFPIAAIVLFLLFGISFIVPIKVKKLSIKAKTLLSFGGIISAIIIFILCVK